MRWIVPWLVGSVLMLCPCVSAIGFDGDQYTDRDKKRMDEKMEADPEDAPPAEGETVTPVGVYLDFDRKWVLFRKIDDWDEAGTSFEKKHILKGNAGLLVQELYRQAVSMAAREELGLRTFDRSLGDPRPEHSKVSVLLVTARPKQPQNRIAIYDATRPKLKRLWNLSYSHPDGLTDYRELLTQCEELSRTKFADALRKQFGVKPRETKPAASLAPETIAAQEALLGDMTFPAQFCAVRKAHELINEHGESPLLVGQLVRGYANLGALTSLYQHPMHNVFEARSLLYAQRLVVKHPDSAAALRYRAYGLALCGADGRALEDLETAKNLPGDALASELPTTWLADLENFCRYETVALGQAAEKEEAAQLTTLLWFLATERAGSRQMTISAGTTAIDRLPECYRIYDSIGYANQNSRVAAHVTLAKSPALAAKLYDRLGAMADLPKAVRSALDRPTAEGLAGLIGGEEAVERVELMRRSKVADALKRTPTIDKADKDESEVKPEIDAAELKWTVLGQMIEEESFNFVLNRAYYLWSQWGGGAEDFVAANQAAIRTHRYRELMGIFSSDPAQQKRAAEAFTKVVDWSTQEPINGYAREVLRRVKKETFSRLGDCHFVNRDDCVQDLIADVRDSVDDAYLLTAAMHLLEVSPHCPFAQAILVEQDAAEVRDQFKGWEQAGNEHPRLLEALGAWYWNHDRREEAVVCYEKAIEIDGLSSRYESLGRLYDQLGKEDVWLKKLQDQLDQPGPFLYHARLQVIISQHFRAKRQWKKAEPYADAAAATYAAWALEEAAIVKEGLQDWAAANALYRAICEQYGPDNAWDWYLFCKRTGQGDLDDARKLIQTEVNRFEQTRDKRFSLRGAMYLTLEHSDRHEQTADCMKTTFYNNRNAIDGLLWAFTYIDMKKPDEFEKLLEFQYDIWKRFGATDTPLVRLSAYIQEDFASSRKNHHPAGFAKFDHDKIEAIHKVCSYHTATWVDYLVGRYCAQHGNTELAIRHWKRAAASLNFDHNGRTLACAALWDMGIAPSQYKAALHGEPDAEQEAKETDKK